MRDDRYAVILSNKIYLSDKLISRSHCCVTTLRVNIFVIDICAHCTVKHCINNVPMKAAKDLNVVARKGMFHPNLKVFSDGCFPLFTRLRKSC